MQRRNDMKTVTVAADKVVLVGPPAMKPKVVARELKALAMKLGKAGEINHREFRIFQQAYHWCERLAEMMQIANGK
jgi:hypothetical protein